MATATDTYAGWEVEALRMVWDKILRPPGDGRGRIDVFVSGELVAPAVAAIRYFTATEAAVSLDPVNMRYRLQAAGYRAGPAGDH